MDSFESRMNPRFLAESEQGILWEPRVIESGRGTVEGFKDDEKEKRRASVLSSFSLSWFSIIHVFIVCACIEFFGEVGHFTERSGFLELCVSCKKLMIYRVVSYDIGVVYRTKRMGPSTEPWGTLYMSCDGNENELLTEVDWYLSEMYDWNRWSAVDWMPKTGFRRERRIWHRWSIVSKEAERSNKRRTEINSNKPYGFCGC